MADEQEKAEKVEIVDVFFPTFYTNNIQLSSGPLDFHMLIMERLDVANMTIRARVVMTPAHARLLAEALIEQIRKYEGLFGPITIPRLLDTKPSASEPEPPPSQSPSASSD